MACSRPRDLTRIATCKATNLNLLHSPSLQPRELAPHFQACLPRVARWLPSAKTRDCPHCVTPPPRPSFGMKSNWAMHCNISLSVPIHLTHSFQVDFHFITAHARAFATRLQSLANFKSHTGHLTRHQSYQFSTCKTVTMPLYNVRYFPWEFKPLLKPAGHPQGECLT